MIRPSEEDIELVNRFRKTGVLATIKNGKIPCSTGTVTVFCGDAHQSSDLMLHHERICSHHNQILALNGGSLLIPTDSPVRGETNMREGQVLLKNIRRSVKAGITTVILYAHWPCTAAHENHVDLLSAFWLHTKAITRVKEEVPTAFHLFSFFHFTNQGKKNTYVFDSAKFSASVIGKNALKKVS